MLYHDRIDFSEGTDANKSGAANVCIINTGMFLDKGFKFQSLSVMEAMMHSRCLLTLTVLLF